MAARAIYTLVVCTAAALLLLAVVSPCAAGLSLDTVREFLTREEDAIVFSLIERAKYPLNRPAYDAIHLGDGDSAGPPVGRRLNASFAELFIRESEAVQSKVQFNRQFTRSSSNLFRLIGSRIQSFLFADQRRRI
jgi:chorismate mutase